MNDLDVATRLAIAALTGLAVGFEREWSGHATGPSARFAGVRTFMLLGGIGGIAGWLSLSEALPLSVTLVLAAGGVIVAAYLAAIRRNPSDLDGTTEVAAVAVMAIGALAGRGHLALASGAAAVVVLALGEKAVIRRAVASIAETEMRAAVQFAVLALVVLPLLPEGPYGPFDAIRPRMIWIVVLIFSGLNFAGYLAQRSFGETRGFLITGALGGLVSSTAVAFAFARRSHNHPKRAAALAAGTIAASAVLLPRIVVVTAAINRDFAPRVGLWLAGIAGASLLLTLWAAFRSRDDDPSSDGHAPINPLQLGTAIRMALAFQAVLLVIEAARAWFGELGVFAGAAVAGLTDMDALTLSMSRLARDPGMEPTAAAALLIGVIANTVLKAVIALGLGVRGFRARVVPAFGLIAAAGAASWWLLRSA